MLIKIGFLFFFAFAAFGAAAPAQDLGSSTGTSRSSSTKPASSSKTATKTPPKSVSKPSPKPRPSISKSVRTAPKPSGRTATRKPATTPLPKTVSNPIPDGNVVITIGSGAEEQLEKAIEEGNSARDERDYARSESAYRRAAGLNPRDSRAFYGLGNVYADQQRWEEAESQYRDAIRIEPGNPGAHVALSFVLTQPIIGGNLSDRYAEAETLARAAIGLDPSNAFAHDQLGAALELRGIISAETQNAYLKAIEIEPGFALAYAHLGRLYRRLGKIPESSEAYRKAIQYSNDVPTMILVADVMQSQQRFLESEQLLRRAISQDPKNPTALNLLGRALTTRNSFDEAEKLFRTSVAVSPNSVVAYALLSSLNQRRLQFDEAEKILMDALRIVAANERKRLAREFEALGDALQRNGRAADANRLYRQAMALDSSRTILSEKLTKLR